MLRTLVHRLTLRPFRTPAATRLRRSVPVPGALRVAAVAALAFGAVLGVGLTTALAVSAAGHPAVAAVALVGGTALLFAMPVVAAWGAVALIVRLTR